MPVMFSIAILRARRDPDLAVTNRHWRSREIVGPEVEGTASGNVKSRVVPVTGQDAVLHCASVQRETQVRAAVVDGENASTVVADQNGTAVSTDDHHPLRFDLVERPDPHET